MLAIVGVASIASGTALACWAERAAALQSRLELWGGALLIVGFALIGVGLPLFR